MKPKTQYARSGDVNIAYQVVGDGPRDLIFVPGWVSNIELMWEEPFAAHFLGRLASFSRLILFDKRGTGLSDRVADMPSLEIRMDDVRAVMDAVGSSGAALLGFSEGGSMSCLFAATYPTRTSALIVWAGYARRTWAPDHPYGPTAEELEAMVDTIAADWGGDFQLELRAPSLAGDPHFRDAWARYLRMSASPGAAQTLLRMNGEIDVRAVLPTIRVPSLILHRTGDRAIPVGMGRSLAATIPGAKFIEIAGEDHLAWVGNSDPILDEIEEFLTGARHVVEPDRVLTTVMFTDIVDSTRRAAELGDRRWCELLDAHHALVREEIARFRGREIDTAGDGFLATFDGPARGVRAATAIASGVRRLGLDVRAGVHTGECEIMGAKLGGVAVHIGARIATLAKAGEVLVSSTVKDLVAGSGLTFADRGTYALKGVGGEWRLFSVNSH